MNDYFNLIHLTPWPIVLLDNGTTAHKIKKFSTVYATRDSIP
jgi:hypothetical protein